MVGSSSSSRDSPKVFYVPQQKPIRNSEHSMVNKVSFSAGGSEMPLGGKVNIEEIVDRSQNIDDDKVPCREERMRNIM